jgi:hypothetical protein
MAVMTNDTTTITDTTTNDTTTNDSTIPTTDNLTRLLDLHLAAYCEPDPARRATLVAQAWTDDGSIIDPPFDGTGHEAICAMADGVLLHFPGHTFRRTTAIDAHHTFARYGWQLVAPDGSVAIAGTDIVELAADGRLGRIIGFFGDLA